MGVFFSEGEVELGLDAAALHDAAALAGDAQLVRVGRVEGAQLAEVVAGVPVVRNSVAVMSVFGIEDRSGALEHALAAMVVTEYADAGALQRLTQYAEKRDLLVGGVEAGLPDLVMARLVLDGE